jgi:[citrate (pro-3S)-lyase] ligase
MSWESFDERSVDLKNKKAVAAVEAFLAGFELLFDAAVDYTVALYKAGRMAATGSLAGEVLRNIAVDHALQGEGLTAAVVSHLMREAARRGRYHYFIYTRPGAAHLFSALGFSEIARADPYAALLESGIGSIEAYCRELTEKVKGLPPGPRAAAVVNCNPFTLGHKALIAKAAAENASVVVMVVEEDRSLFPFAARFELVRQGLSEYKNVLILPGGKYVISAATFPAYFTRGDEVAVAQTRLDISVFARHIAPALGVTSRYAGDEPCCGVTNIYNQAMLAILPSHGIKVRVMARLTADGDVPVSASQVREFIRQDNWDEISRLVPETTYHYLRSPEAAPVIDLVKTSGSRH